MLSSISRLAYGETLMIRSSWTDSNFYHISERFQYTIRGEICLKEKIDREILQDAVNLAFHRFPYFCARVLFHSDEFIVVPNLLPNTVISTDKPVVLGSEEVNYHLVVITCFEDQIVFHVSHCITDGAGRSPFTKTVLYYYLAKKYALKLDTEGICLAGDAMFPDECGEPISIRKLMKETPVCQYSIGEAYKLTDGCRVWNRERREYRFHIDEQKCMKICRELNATPSALLSVLLARACWKQNPHIHKNIVHNLCLDMRKSLHNEHSHLLLLASIPLIFSPSMQHFSIKELCNEAKRLINEQKQEQHVRYLCKKNILEFDKIRRIKDLKMRESVVQAHIHGREGFLSSTFILSYMGRNHMGSLAPYIKSMYTAVDAVPDDGAIIEVTSVNGRFFFTWTQDFTEECFVSFFLEELKLIGLSADEFCDRPVLTAKIKLPDTIDS